MSFVRKRISAFTLALGENAGELPNEPRGETSSRGSSLVSDEGCDHTRNRFGAKSRSNDFRKNTMPGEEGRMTNPRVSIGTTIANLTLRAVGT